MQHVLSVDQFDRTAIEQLFKAADAMRELVQKQGGDSRFAHRVSANLFYEPSTRTFSSFATAMYRLGGQVIPITDVKNASVVKGETLEDTIRMLAGYADAIVLRHPEKGAAARAAAVSTVPILNAGDGVGEHPTQGLLDAYTIYLEKGTLDGLTVTLLGDLKYGRTPHSLAKLLNLFDDITLNFVAPKSLEFPADLQSELKYTPTITDSLDDVIASTDVLYATRVQKERIDDPAEYEKIGDAYTVNQKVLDTMKPDAIIMHPLPRIDEITTEVDADPRAAYFREAENGLYIRMALLDMLISQ